MLNCNDSEVILFFGPLLIVVHHSDTELKHLIKLIFILDPESFIHFLHTLSQRLPTNCKGRCGVQLIRAVVFLESPMHHSTECKVEVDTGACNFRSQVTAHRTRPIPTPATTLERRRVASMDA